MLPDQYVEQLIGVYYADFIQEPFFMHFSTVQIPWVTLSAGC